jgi:hypothetical protein
MARVKPTTSARLQAAGAITVIVVCAVAVAAFYWPIHHLILQVYAVAALLIGLHACPPIARWLASTPVAHRVVLYALLAAVIAGHFTLQQRRYFPFVVWDIFSAVNEQETVFSDELVGTTASGKQIRLVVEQLFPSIVQFDLPPHDEPLKMERLVRVLAAQYNQHHATDPVREVDLFLMAVKLHLPPGQSRVQPSCELLHRFDLSPAPSS